ncbi:MAG TPA: cyclic nucleotide-binding domain-containing protein [Candidatus Limnocylindrales bacterium]
MIERMTIADELAGLALFADLSSAQLEGVAHLFDEGWFPSGERILRQGLTGSGFYLVLDGEVAIRQGDRELARLGRGDFFGDISALLGEPPVADVVALGPVRCLHLAATELRDALVAYPTVLFRMLVEQTRRLRNAERWQR